MNGGNLKCVITCQHPPVFYSRLNISPCCCTCTSIKKTVNSTQRCHSQSVCIRLKGSIFVLVPNNLNLQSITYYIARMLITVAFIYLSRGIDCVLPVPSVRISGPSKHHTTSCMVGNPESCEIIIVVITCFITCTCKITY